MLCHSSRVPSRVHAAHLCTSVLAQTWALNPARQSALSRSQAQVVLTLDMSLNTDTCACSKSSTTSRKLLIIDSSSPTARVIRLARLLRNAWSMFSSQGEPGARKALYSPDVVCQIFFVHNGNFSTYHKPPPTSRARRPICSSRRLFPVLGNCW